MAAAVFAMAPQITEGFRTGAGWHEHGAGLFEGVERFFRSGYRANLVSAWIPALEGVEAKLHCCTPASLAQDGRMALGSQAGPARLEEVIRTAGFTWVRQATETPFNIVLEARP